MQPVLAWDNLGQAPAGWGSHVILPWAQWEPVAGQYRYDLIDEALGRAVRPCFLQLAVSIYNSARGAPQDYTPAPYKRSLRLLVGGRSGEIPPYDSAWTAAYNAAVSALAARYRTHPQVVGYWCAPGWNQETQAAAATSTGDWAAAARPLLRESVYCDWVLSSTRHALAVWRDVPVWLPGAPSPGNVWGHKRREIIADLLAAGAGYLNCGLQIDNSNAVGIGERAGLAMYDIAQGAGRRAFEEGVRQAPGNSDELYWLLLRARHWGAEYVNLYGSLSAPEWNAAASKLPPSGARWLVFRAAEHPAQKYTSGGKVYGYSGEPGCWGVGLAAEDLPMLTFAPERFDAGRWQLAALQPFTLRAPGLADGLYEAQLWHAAGTVTALRVDVQAERVLLPAGVYHRVDLLDRALTLEERVAALERRLTVLEAGR